MLTILRTTIFIFACSQALISWADVAEGTLQPTAAVQEVIREEKPIIEAYLEKVPVETPEALKTGSGPVEEALLPCPLPPQHPVPEPVSAIPTPDASWTVEFAGGIASVVNGRVITIEEIRREMTPMIPQLQRESPNIAVFQRRADALAHQVLENIEDRILVIQYADEKGVRMPDAYFKNYFNGHMADTFGSSRAQYQEYLKATNQTDTEYKNMIREQLLFNGMRSEKFRTSSEVSPKKVNAYYEANKNRFAQEASVHLRQIMLTPANANQSMEILDKLAQGVPFDLLAKQYSQDDKATQGGDWGWINHSDIREELSDVAFALEPKTYAKEPIDLGGTRFILYIEDKRTGGVPELKEVRGHIEEMMAQELAQESYEKWIQQLRSTAAIMRTF